MHTVKVPSCRFSFKDLCKINPNTLPLNLMQFLTKEIAAKRITKTRADENAPPIYFMIPGPSDPSCESVAPSPKDA